MSETITNILNFTGKIVVVLSDDGEVIKEIPVSGSIDSHREFRKKCEVAGVPVLEFDLNDIEVDLTKQPNPGKNDILLINHDDVCFVDFSESYMFDNAYFPECELESSDEFKDTHIFCRGFSKVF